MDTESDKLVIAVLAGTSRAKRVSIHAARYVAEFGRGIDGVEIIFVDPADFEFPRDGDDPEGKDPHYTNITQRADAFFIVTPEYNHSFPSTIKRMLDSEYKNYFHKPVALAGASDGPWGGVRAIEALVHPLRTMSMIVLSTDVHFPYVPTMFDEHGALLPECIERTNRNLQSAYDELIWMARVMKQASKVPAQE